MKRFLKYILLILALVIIDQATKDVFLYLITGGVPLYGAAWTVVPVPYLMSYVTDFFNLVFTWNPGTSFSLFRALGEAAPLIIIIATAFIIGYIMHYLFARSRDWERMPLCLIAGGAIGNLIDRVRFGAVIDFLDFHIGGWHYPSFNFADICICVGVGLYVLNWYMARRKCMRACQNGGKK